MNGYYGRVSNIAIRRHRTRVISKRRSNSSFKVFKLLGTRARATSTVSLQTSSSGTSTTGTFLGSPETSTLFISDLSSNL